MSRIFIIFNLLFLLFVVARDNCPVEDAFWTFSDPVLQCSVGDGMSQMQNLHDRKSAVTLCSSKIFIPGRSEPYYFHTENLHSFTQDLRLFCRRLNFNDADCNLVGVHHKQRCFNEPPVAQSIDTSLHQELPKSCSTSATKKMTKVDYSKKEGPVLQVTVPGGSTIFLQRYAGEAPVAAVTRFCGMLSSQRQLSSNTEARDAQCEQIRQAYMALLHKEENASHREADSAIDSKSNTSESQPIVSMFNLYAKMKDVVVNFFNAYASAIVAMTFAVWVMLANA